MTFELLLGLKEGAKTTELLTVSEWAEKHRYLSPEASFLGGALYQCSVTPYAKKIMDSLSAYSPYQEVIFCKSSQTGGTEIGNNWLGYIIHICPAPVLMLMPTDSTVERNSKIRIDPMISHSEVLRTRVGDKKSRDGDNTINQKRFPGGVLYMGGANSPAVLKSIPVRFVMLDEVDEYPTNLGGQGSADGLAKVRTRMFPNRKIYYVSTPTVEGQSLIMRKFQETDQNYFEVPCPFCGGFQRLIFGQLKVNEENDEEVKYECIHCKALIDEVYKTDMLAKGEWMPSNLAKVNNRRIGFHINSLYSPSAFFKWSEIIEAYRGAEKDPNEMKVFVNTILGETWAEESEAPAWENIYNRRELYEQNKPPLPVCFLTCGVDVQKDRLELEIVGWSKDKQSYSIDYRVLIGKPVLPEVWLELEKILSETWIRPDGVELGLKLMAIDSGYSTDEVYSFCRRFPSNRVIPVKGSDSLGIAIAPPKAIDLNHRGKRIGRIKVWNVGVSFLKKEFYSWLSIEKGEALERPCYCHFPQYGETYFRGLTAEDWIPAKRQWKKRFERNEPLDTRIYARAASVVVGLDRLKPDQIAALAGTTKAIVKPEEKKEEKKKRKIESIW
jgi:phage terminase large subunit GpA-like protein